MAGVRAAKAVSLGKGVEANMSDCLFINGIYEAILDDIEKTQGSDSGKPCFLQPYSTGRIKLLAKSNPTPKNPITLYISLSKSLNAVSFRAKIVGWQDKRELAKNPAALARLKQHIANFQKHENGVYLEAEPGKPCVNLISVIDLTRLKTPFPVSCLIKTSDGTPLKNRTRSGNWSVVREQLPWLGTLQQFVEEDVESELQVGVTNSRTDDSAARQERLATAPKKPEPIQIVSRSFLRNRDVIVEALFRAKGICEQCHCPAPFHRASDDTPYLEVHHRIMLSEGGEDTVANALALCPNCHRKLHFGKSDNPSED